ncbi:MAG: BrnT family toxin [Acidobacteriota bacterium]|nr:BrnT family toxin [Acidobacteriota bacterium]
MLYEWDPDKARRNRETHGVSFPDAVGVFEDELAVTLPDPFVHTEKRFITMGRDPLGRLLVVVYTWRGDRIRLISARKSTGRERRQYEEG